MRWALLGAAMAVSVSAGAGAAALDLRMPHMQFANATSSEAICDDVNFNIYFEHDKARLTEPAEHMFDLISNHVRGCQVGSLTLQTPVSDVTSPEARRVAELRSAAIVKAFRDRGVRADAVMVSHMGSANEPASATPPHVTVAMSVTRPALSADRAPAKNANNDA